MGHRRARSMDDAVVFSRGGYREVGGGRGRLEWREEKEEEEDKGEEHGKGEEHDKGDESLKKVRVLGCA